MQLQVKEIKARSILTPQKVGFLSAYFDYALNRDWFAAPDYARTVEHVAKMFKREQEAEYYRS